MQLNRQYPVEATRSMWGAVLVGIGVMGGIDEIIFHQLLGWHHFYDLSTPAIGLVSDGLLHAIELLAIVGGFFLLLDLRQSRTLAVMSAWSGFFLGAGSFQLFDGLITHKVLRLHQIRYEVPLLPYDLLWNLSALILIAVGLMLLKRARS